MKRVVPSVIVITCIVVVASLLTSGCANEAHPSGALVAKLPVAALACPVSVAAGAPFDVDASASEGDLVAHHIKLSPGGDDVDGLAASFTAPGAGVATVTLTVADKHGATATASCRVRIDVGGLDAGGGGAGDGEGDSAGEGEGDGAAEGEGAGDGEGDGGDGEGDAAGDGEGEALGAPVDLTGTFALVAYDAPTLSGGALDPSQQCTSSPSLSLVTIAQGDTADDSAQIDMTVQLCRMTLPVVRALGLGVQVTDAPDAIADALPVLSTSFTLLHAAEGADFAPPLADLGRALVAGATLVHDADPLPTGSDDGRIVDADDDGRPGVTVRHSLLGDQDAVLRRRIRAFHGIIRSSDVVDGGAAGSFRLDGDATVLSLPLSSFLPAGQGRPSTFRLVRVDGATTTSPFDLADDDGAVDCDALRAHFDELIATQAPPTAPDSCPTFEE